MAKAKPKTSTNGHAGNGRAARDPDRVAAAATAEMVMNVISTRREFLNHLLDEHRDINNECGYPELISSQEFRAMFDREAIAQRVNNLYSRESWVEDPDIYETEDQEETEFEIALQELNERTHLLHFLARIDEMSGIGHFGVLLLGFDDGKPLNEAIGSVDKKTGDLVPGKAQHRLVFVRAFDESLVTVGGVEADIKSPRYGQPTLYNIQLMDPALQTQLGATVPTQSVVVHWSRVIHVADNRMSSEVYGVPRMQCVWNRLVDLRRLYGGSAEMFWKGAFPGYSFETNPDLTDATLDADAMREEFFRYSSGLQRYLALQGVAAKSLSPQVADPTNHVKTQLEAISIALEVPMRVFMGSERGELASSQDARAWNKRVMRRQNTYLTPMVIRPTIDRLIALGALPEPKGETDEKPKIKSEQDKLNKAKMEAKKAAPPQPPPAPPGKAPPGKAPPPLANAEPAEMEEESEEESAEANGKPKKKSGPKYYVSWPDLNTLDETAQAALAGTRTEALVKYISGQVESLVPPLHYLTSPSFHNIPEDEARSIMEAAIEQIETETKATEEMAAEQPPPDPNQPPGAPPGQQPPGGGNPFGGPPKGSPPFQPTVNECVFDVLSEQLGDEELAADVLANLAEAYDERILENAFATDLQRRWFFATKGKGSAASSRSNKGGQQGRGPGGKFAASTQTKEGGGKQTTGKAQDQPQSGPAKRMQKPEDIAAAIDSGDVKTARSAMQALGMSPEDIQSTVSKRMASKILQAGKEKKDSDKGTKKQTAAEREESSQAELEQRWAKGEVVRVMGADGKPSYWEPPSANASPEQKAKAEGEARRVLEKTSTKADTIDAVDPALTGAGVRQFKKPKGASVSDYTNPQIPQDALAKLPHVGGSAKGDGKDGSFEMPYIKLEKGRLVISGGRGILDKIKQLTGVVSESRQRAAQGRQQIATAIRDIPAVIQQKAAVKFLEHLRPFVTATESVAGGVNVPQEAIPIIQPLGNTAPTGNARSFASTQVNLPGRLRRRVLALAARIPDKDLANPAEGLGREEEPHVTVLYGLQEDDPAGVAEMLAGVGPVRLRLGRTSLFPANESQSQRGGERYDVVKLDVESDDLRRLNLLLAALPHTNKFPVYVPHVTLAYVKPGAGKFYEDWDELEGLEVTIDELKFSPADGEPAVIPLDRELAMNAFANAASRRAFFAKLAADKATGGGGKGKKLGGALTGPAKRSAMDVLKGDPDLDATEIEPEYGRGEPQKKIKELFGRELSPEELASLANAPSGSTVKVLDAGRDRLEVYSNSERHDAVRFVKRDHNGDLVLENSSFEVFENGTGLGSKLLARQVDAAQKLGVKLIETHAARGDDTANGYYTWPRLGYNADLDGLDRKSITEGMDGPLKDLYLKAETVQDLFRLPGGLEAWRLRGNGKSMSFDPTPGSRSRQVLDAYIAARFSEDE